MSRVPLSVRFPGDLAAVLDHVAERGKASRSAVVETVIRAVEAEDRAPILETTVGAPTEKRNLRLSDEAVERLRQLAGDMPPSEFLRRAVAYAADKELPEWRSEFSGDTARQAQSDSHYLQTAEDDPRVEVVGAPIGMMPIMPIIGVVLIVGAVVSFVVWLIFWLSERSAQRRGIGPQGQLSDGNSAMDPA